MHKNEYGQIGWLTAETRLGPKLVMYAQGFVGPDKILDAISQSNLSESEIEANMRILDWGWGRIMDLFKVGGVMTRSGKMHLDITDLELPEELKNQIENQVTLSSKPLQLWSKYGLKLKSPQHAKQDIILFIRKSAEEELAFNYRDILVRQFFPSVSASRFYRLDFVVESALQNMFRLLYAEQSVTNIVSPNTAAEQILFDIALRFGQGYQQEAPNLPPLGRFSTID